MSEKLEKMLKMKQDDEISLCKEIDALKAELEAVKAKHAEVLSYLPKVPTQPYEKELAQKLDRFAQANELLRNAMEEMTVDDCGINIDRESVETLRDILRYIDRMGREALSKVDKLESESGE